MEEVKNITHDEVLELINNFPFKPLRNRLIITVNVSDSDAIDLSGDTFSDTQYVIATGSFITEFKPGNKIVLDIPKMMDKNTESIRIDPLEYNGRIYAYINDSVVKSIDTRV